MISNSAYSQDTPDTHGINAKRYQEAMGKSDRGQPGQIHWGPLIINPKLSEKIETDDNAFQVSAKGIALDGQRERKRSDITNTVSPGLRLTLPIRGGWWLPGKDHSLSADWKADYKNNRDNAQQNQHNHFVKADAMFSFPHGFDVHFQDSYSDTFGASGGETDNLHGVISNTFSTMISLPDYFRTFDVDFTYENFDQQYDEKGLARANRNAHNFTLRVPHNLSPKVTIFPEYSYTITEFQTSRVSDPQSDSHTNQIMAGIEWSATARTTGSFKIGHTYMDFDDIDKHNVNTITAILGVTVDLSSRMDLRITAGRKPSIAEFTANSNASINNSSRIDLSRQLQKDWKVSLYFSFDKNTFLDSERKDHVVGIGFTSKYNINKWMNVDVQHSYKDRHVNFELQSDRINKSSVGINFAF